MFFVCLSTKLEHALDNCIVQPTLRTVDFIEDAFESKQKDAGDTERERRFNRAPRRLRVVRAPTLSVVDDTFVAGEYPKSAEDEALIDAALKENLVFAGLTTSKRAELIKAFEPEMFKRDTEVIVQDSIGDYFYIVGRGEVQFQIDGKEVGTATRGGSFGEQALLYSSPRAATCIAKTTCGLFRLGQETFRYVCGGRPLALLGPHLSRARNSLPKMSLWAAGEFWSSRSNNLATR